MNGFEIDTKAFRAQNAGRPPEHLIRELIQNAFDESPKNVTVSVAPGSVRGVIVTVTDDGLGFSDEKEIWTIFASGKRDDATKRGRLGRGLKELISVANAVTIETRIKRITFTWDGKQVSRRVGRIKPVVGTRIEAYVALWSKSTIDQIVAYLRTFVAPEGTTMWVNGEANLRPLVEHTLKCMLPTVRYSPEGVPSEPWENCTVKLLSPTGDKWIYEMGIPVEKVLDEDGFRWSIDVGQRTPLRPERDQLPRRYVHALYAYVANEMVDKVPPQELTALWMEEGVGNHNFDKGSKGKVYVERRFGQNAARAVVADPHDRNVTAQEHGINVIRTQDVSASVRDILTQHTRTTADLFPVKCAEARFITEAEWTDGERRFIGFGKWLAAEMSLPVPSITIYDAPQANCEADSCESGTRIRLNRSGVGSSFFQNPRIAMWLPLIVHELAHRTGNGHDAVYWREVERLSGEAAEALLRSPDVAWNFIGQVAPGRATPHIGGALAAAIDETPF